MRRAAVLLLRGIIFGVKGVALCRTFCGCYTALLFLRLCIAAAPVLLRAGAKPRGGVSRAKKGPKAPTQHIKNKK